MNSVTTMVKMMITPTAAITTCCQAFPLVVLERCVELFFVFLSFFAILTSFCAYSNTNVPGCK